MQTRSFGHVVLLVMLAALLAISSLPAQAQCSGDCIMSDQFENEFFLPDSDAEAARFLNQTSFGATKATISALNSTGFEQWIDQQFALPQTLARPFLEAVAKVRHDQTRTIDQTDRIHRWYDTAVVANDQLRQKMAYALGQIIVTSDQNDNLSGQPLQMAEWNDILVRNAFGNYQNLLREASFSPMMGRYLTHLRNRRYELDPQFNQAGAAPILYTITSYTAANSGNEPDENYAREVMQLFSIGLESRNQDFSLIDIDPGMPGVQIQPTYDQQMIRTLSRAFTGLAYDCTASIPVQGHNIVQNCAGQRNSTPLVTPPCTGTQCRFSNRSNLFFNDPTRGDLPGGTANSQDSSLVHPDFFRPMVCYPHYNDNGRDVDRFQLSGQGPTNPVNTTFGGGVVIPAGAPESDKALTLSGVTDTLEEFQPGVSKETALNCSTTDPLALTTTQRQQCIDYCENNVRSAVDLLFLHPNTPPMVARQLILRFVSSNPSPAYIARVADKFVNNGSGVRGDLKATLKAVLMDTEARQPFAGQFGKPREPLLRMVAVWRNFGYISGGNTCRNNNNSSVGNGNIACWGTDSPQNSFFQRPLGAPSVFNFYEPDYQPPGSIANAGLYGPEFQIINENSTMQTANEMFRTICENYSSNDNCTAILTTLPTNRAYLPLANLDALPGIACGADLVNGCTGAHDRDLIEELNLRMLGGQMSGQIGNPALCTDPLNFGMKSVLHNLVGCGLAGNLGQTGANAGRDARRRKALYLIHLVAISPEYAHQR